MTKTKTIKVTKITHPVHTHMKFDRTVKARLKDMSKTMNVPQCVIANSLLRQALGL